MNTSEWTDIIVAFIDGIVDSLPQTCTNNARTDLNAFRKQALRAHDAKSRKHCEQQLEIYLQSTAQLQTAAAQYLKPKVETAVEGAIRSLALAERMLNREK